MASSSSSSWSFKYDVFLSFRGEDTRKTFVDHLHAALKLHLIGTYKDDETLSRGESIGPSLFKGIEDSRIVVIVFSKNYACSSWCLEELAHIMKCKEERELIVMPIFYDVDPSDVRKQKGDFGTAFAQLDVDNNKAQLWRNALVDASNIAGWEPKHIANGHESKVIKEIVDKVRGRLLTSNADVDEDLVGIETRLEDLKSKLEVGSEGVRMVGIWGCGGIGKTTLATSIYMELRHHFQGHCIVENIREESRKFDLKKLQENMLSAIVKNEVMVPNIAEGKRQMKTMLCSKNVLIILDDVDSRDQLDALAGSHSWFGSGSRIIITTRDEHLLTTHKVDEVCDVKLLSRDEAMQLFNKRAYNERKPVEDYETLSSRIVSYADGLPLALKVLGSFLYDKDKKGWISALDRLKDNPDLKIVEKLKISYDGLETVEKELFLDIACFFRGWYKSNAMEILEACGFHPEIGIEVLRQKALITVSRDGEFDMHDLVQEMGHFIVKGEHPNSPDKHSRIWKHEEIYNMHLTMENDRIEAIRYENYKLYCPGLDSSQFCKSVSNMKKLRSLTVSMINPKIVEGPNFLSNELRYIEWAMYPGKSPFPDSFQPMKLVDLKLGYSFQKHVWKGCKHLPHLKVLQLRYMRKLLRTPDFDGLPCLQELTLVDCPKLKEILPSLGNHKSLQSVHVSWCGNLRMFPAIVHMENLQTLEILRCNSLLEFPKLQANMEGLVNLSVEATGIQVLPSSIGERCTNLTSLKLSRLKNLKSIEFNFDALKHLKTLRLQQSIQHVKKTRWRPRFRHFKDVVEIPPSIIELSNLQELDLSSNDFSRFDFSLSRLTQLELLSVPFCEKLLELPELPSSLTILDASGCTSLTTFGDCHKNCRRLCQVSLRNAGIISDGQELLEFMLEACMAGENQDMVLELTGVEIAKGFTPPLRGGGRCTLQLPENWCNDFSGFLICAVLTGYVSGLSVSISMNDNEEMNGMDSELDIDEIWALESDGVNKCTWIAYASFGSLKQTAVWWDQTYKALSFKTKKDECYGFGVRLIDKKKSRSGSTETSTNYSSAYTPTLNIYHRSMSAVELYLSI